MSRFYLVVAVIWLAGIVGSFALFSAYNDRPRVRVNVVKAKVLPVLIEGPNEVKR